MGSLKPGICEAETISFESSEISCLGRKHRFRPPFRPDVPETIGLRLPEMAPNWFQRYFHGHQNVPFTTHFLGLNKRVGEVIKLQKVTTVNLREIHSNR
jgi:hypothetical protein